MQHITQTSEFNGQSFSSLMKRGRFQRHFAVYVHHLRAEATELRDESFHHWLRKRTVSEQSRAAFLQWLMNSRANRSSTDVPLFLNDMALKCSLENCLKVFDATDAALAPGDDATFEMLLFARERFFEEVLVEAGIQVQRHIEFKPMIFFWLRTGSYSEEAAFMFAESERDALGATITTVDPHFIKLFDGIFEREWRETSSLSPV